MTERAKLILEVLSLFNKKNKDKEKKIKWTEEQIQKADEMIDAFEKKIKDAVESKKKYKGDSELEQQYSKMIDQSKDAIKDYVDKKKELVQQLSDVKTGKKAERKEIEGIPPDAVVVFGKVIVKGKQIGYIDNGKFRPGKQEVAGVKL
jgi:leucyl-tRNA synthetase